jgi:transcriptional regulator GlxA family with amidase domain
MNTWSVLWEGHKNEQETGLFCVKKELLGWGGIALGQWALKSLQLLDGKACFQR